MHVAGEEIRSTMSAAFHSMGYSPQHDPLWEDVTLREHLQCYARIKGLAEQDIQAAID